jgi:hypothetical protein
MEYLFTYKNKKIYVIKCITAPSILDDVDQVKVDLLFTMGKGLEKFNNLDDLLKSIKE